VARDPVDVARRAAAIASIALVAAVVSPVARDPDADGFPLSTYPMFARDRGRSASLAYPIGRTAAGARRVLEPRFTGTTEVLQALNIVERAVAARDADALCRRIAAGVAADPGYADVATVEIVTATHDAVDYLVRDQVGSEFAHARCPVAR